MSAIKALELREQPSGVVVATPKLTVVEGGLPRASRRRPRRSRENPNSLWDVPPGFMGRCPVPTCRIAIPEVKAHSDIVICSRGHAHSQQEEAHRFWEGKNRRRRDPHSGLCPKDFGDIAEHVLYQLRDLGEYGRIVWRHRKYNSPVDFITDRGFAIECKGVDMWGENLAYCLGKDEKDRKTAWVLERGLTPLAVLVPVNLPRSSAEIHLRSWPDRFKYFERPKTIPPFAVRRFRVPKHIRVRLRAIENAAMVKATNSDDLPF